MQDNKNHFEMDNNECELFVPDFAKHFLNTNIVLLVYASSDSS